ncbi:MAG: DEAD/DEAH box helicase [Patescibacteria group bacterium]|nr:DEAD/DEAH box helicase [Patescibacteria group bacterium]
MTPAIAVPDLYDYQQAQVDDIRAQIRAGRRRVLLVSPTGSGKGTIATWMIARALERKSRVIFLVNRRELVKDTSRRLDRLGVDHGVIMGNHPRRKPWLSVHIASIDTLHRREVLPPADLIFADECHFSISPTWRKVLDRYTCPVVGMSATPIRADGRGLGEFFDAMVQGPSVADLISRGFLAPPRIFAPSAPELAGVKVQHGEYNQKQLAQCVDRSTLIGDVVQHWLRIAQGRPTVAFAVSVEHSRHIVDQFAHKNIRAVHVDAETPDEERDRIWAGLAGGSIDVCSSVGVISYGWDVPPVSCAILARPTKSLALYLQQIGRVLRRHESKRDALILDHAGCCLEHGFPDDEREWSLEGVRKKWTGDVRGPSVRMCKNCWAAHPSSRPKCPYCGWEPEKQELMPDTVEGSLEEVTESEKPKYTIRKLSADPRVAELQKTAAEKGYKPGWVWFQIQRMRQRVSA